MDIKRWRRDRFAVRTMISIQIKRSLEHTLQITYTHTRSPAPVVKITSLLKHRHTTRRALSRLYCGLTYCSSSSNNNSNGLHIDAFTPPSHVWNKQGSDLTAVEFPHNSAERIKPCRCFTWSQGMLGLVCGSSSVFLNHQWESHLRCFGMCKLRWCDVKQVYM